MPGDTLIVTTTVNSFRVKDTLFYKAQISSTPSVLAADAPDNTIFFFSAIGIFALLVIAVFIITGRFRKFRRKKIHEEALEKVNEHYSQYDNLLSGYNGYYKSLSISLRQKFMERAIEFLNRNFLNISVLKRMKKCHCSSVQPRYS